MSATRNRAVRVDDDLWAAAMERAQLEHRSLSSVIQTALRAYAEGRYHAQEPKHTVPKRRRSDE